MLSMISKTSKILLGVYAFLLLVMLMPFSDVFGLFLRIGMGLFTLVTFIFVINDVKKLKNSLSSRILSVVLVSLILYSTMMLFYGLGNMGMGDMGGGFQLTLLAYLIFLGLSLIIGIILVIVNKNQNVQNKPNTILSIILAIILVLLLYSSAVNGMAKLTGTPGFCSMHIGMKSDSFIFAKRMQDNCIFAVASDTLNAEYCKQIEDSTMAGVLSMKNLCFFAVARDLGDISICYQITDDDEWKEDCISHIENE